MAEERISIITYEKDPCENCNGNPMTDCQICEKDLRYDGSMTRAEAIEKMAKAQFAFMWQNKYSWDNVENEDKKSFYKSAEAALNALLGEK